ncbi:MAG: 16S rRNA (uracil(1498)-N(3))-methyltransferase [Acidimicrobiales bacterium]
MEPLDAARNADALVFVGDIDELSLTPDDTHHLVDVLRLRSSSIVVAADGAGAYRICKLKDSETKPHRRRASRVEDARLVPLGPVLRAPLPGREISIGLALGKGDRPEWAVQKLTELGVDRIVFLETARGVVRPDDRAIGHRKERLARVAREAAMQCRRLVLPAISGPVALETALGSAPGTAALAHPGSPPVDESVSSVFVGPEGGFTPDELALAPRLVGLPGHVLRTETAAVASAVLLVAAVHNGTRAL